MIDLHCSTLTFESVASTKGRRGGNIKRKAKGAGKDIFDVLGKTILLALLDVNRFVCSSWVECVATGEKRRRRRKMEDQQSDSTRVNNAPLTGQKDPEQ